MTQPKKPVDLDKTFREPRATTEDDDGQVILLTKVSGRSASSLPAVPPDPPPLKPISNHTLENAPKPSKVLQIIEEESKELPPPPAPFEQEGEEPVVLLEKRATAHTLDGEPSEITKKISPFDTGTDPSQPALPASPSPHSPSTMREEDLLFAMSQELDLAIKRSETVPIDTAKDSFSIVDEGEPEDEDVPWGPPRDSSGSNFGAVSVSVSDPAPPIAMTLFPPSVDEDDELLGDIEELRMTPMLLEPSMALPTAKPPTPAAKPPVSSPKLSPPPAPQAPIMTIVTPSILNPMTGVASTQVDADLSEDMFLQGLLNELARHCARVCLLYYRAPFLVGLDAKGPAPLPHIIQSLMFPTQLPSTFSQVIQNQAPYVGSLPHQATDQMLIASFGPLPQQIAIYPIVQKQQTVALIYLDDAGQEQPFLPEPKAVNSLLKRANELTYRWHPPNLLDLFESSSSSS